MTNIKQGALNTSNLISALCALTCKPNMVENLFINKKANDQGKYSLLLCVNGRPQLVEVDDYLPYDMDGEIVPFAHSKEKGEIWVSLFEKAWAKLHGSYFKTIGASPDIAFSLLTNKPSITLHHGATSAEFWKERLSANDVWLKIFNALRL